MKSKLKDLAPLIIILTTCLIIALIIIFRPQKKVIDTDYDTSFLKNITVSEALTEFKSPTRKIYVIGRSTCSVCQEFLPILKEVVNKYQAPIYYIDLQEMLKDKTNLEAFKKILTFSYTYQGETKEISSYIGATPMIIISENNKNIYGYLGNLKQADLENLLRSYELI